MAFKVGDKVKYDSGEWLFYGTVSAVFDNSINPCYRVTVDRMVKTNCKYSITQFEFELALDSGVPKEVIPIQDVPMQEDLPKVVETEKGKRPGRAKTGAWERNLALFQKGERSNSINTWMSRNRLLYKSNKLSKDKLDTLMAANFPFEARKRKEQAAKPEKVEPPQNLIKEKPKRTQASAWEKNFELFRSGDKNNTVYAWISRNRKMYHAKKLSKEQINKLTAANFQFDAPPRERLSDDSWDKQFRLWQNGNRSRSLEIWKENSLKRFNTGKLSQERIDKLKEAGILT